jgi:membrane carboxypeptidase/penicillin-binding protein PbpC
VAVKTGTARGFASTVALGVTREVTVAVWAGSPDGRPTAGLPAMRAAAPLLRQALLALARDGALTLPPPPAGLLETEVCALTGKLPAPTCTHRKLERLTAAQRPTASCGGHGGGAVAGR